MSSGESNKVKARSRFTPPSSTSEKNVVQNEKATIVSDIFTIVSRLGLFYCRRIIFAPAPFKLIVYFALVALGSILKDNEVVPSSYFSLKTNIFNVYFAKLGWAWTIGLLIPFVYLNLRPTHSYRQILLYHLTRIAIATAVWFIATNLFVVLELYTGSCSHDDFTDVSRKICVQNGHQWNEGHDISGHTFLFIYTLLIINEEVKSYDKAYRNGTNDTSILIFILYISLAILTIIWEVMLLTTALYFHHLIHKLEAVAIAASLWALTYRFWYSPEMKSIFRPASPKDIFVN